MGIEKRPFGQLPSGENVDLYVITNASGASVAISNYGGIVTQINVPDANGAIADVVLGCKDAADYVPNNGYLGALIGRVGNRIGAGKCVLNGVPLQLAANSNGQHLHGGMIGFDKKLWNAKISSENSLTLTYVSPDGEENYPGTLSVTVTYTFTDANELKIHYEAMSDADTLCNLTNHSYFNLAGEASGKTVLDHMMQINADHLTIVDKDFIPTGEQRPVDGTAFDLREPKRVGDGIALVGQDEQLTFAGGYDHNFMLSGEGMRKAVTLYCPETGRVMDVFTDKPAVQFYAGNMLDGTMPGKCGRKYQPREGLCLETQYPPDAINHESFPGGVLRAGGKYDFTTVYQFSVK